MRYCCQVCAEETDEFGNPVKSDPADALVRPSTCLKCRMEALRFKLHGPQRPQRESSLPYADT